jgi:hypothetical protein
MKNKILCLCSLQSLGYVIGACIHKFKYSITAVNTVMVVFLLLGKNFIYL